MEISFIVPAKNTERFIFEMIDSVRLNCNWEWEIIIVDDHSEDNLFESVENFSKKDPRVKIYKNTGKGKVSALNEGFIRSEGKYIKCIDSDDTLDSSFFTTLEEIIGTEASCHDYYIVDENLKKMAVYSMNQSFLKNNYNYVLTNLISLPRAVWTISRNIAEKIFPMPTSLPYEDVWFSLIIKKNAGNIKYINKPLYNYRQHSSQTFGGVLNYSEKVIVFRAKRLVNLIKEFERTGNVLDNDIQSKLSYQKLYYEILGIDKITFRDITTANLEYKDKLKIFLFRKASWSLRFIKRIQWFLDKQKTGKNN